MNSGLGSKFPEGFRIKEIPGKWNKVQYRDYLKKERKNHLKPYSKYI